MSQEILSLGNSVAATIFPKEIMSLSIIEATVFPKEIMSLPGNSVARTKHVANLTGLRNHSELNWQSRVTTIHKKKG